MYIYVYIYIYIIPEVICPNRTNEELKEVGWTSLCLCCSTAKFEETKKNLLKYVCYAEETIHVEHI